MKCNQIVLFAIIAITALLTQQVKAQDTTLVKMAKESVPMKKDMMPMAKDSMPMEKNKMPMHNMMMPDLKSWPEASQMAVKEITDKYGKADVMGDEVFIWMNKGPWEIISISKKESKHSFPIEHTDMLTQSVFHKVPTDKYNDLAKFDGSVTVDRTQGLISARCDMEANNMLALNLAHDIIKGKKTVAQARKAYGDMVKEKMNGGNPAYMQKLTFASERNSADADINTTGLTKADIMKALNGDMNINASAMQENMDDKMDYTIHKKMLMPNMRDGIMMKAGKMMQMKAGKSMMMKKDMVFPNGNIVMINGTMKMKDGTTHNLKEGDCVMMDGTMKSVPMKKMKDFR